jgi:glyceraldehyde 3-phosphate dehydrogenase
LAHLLKYDSIHGRFNGTVDFNETHLIINGKEILALAKKNPANLPWAKLGVDVVWSQPVFLLIKKRPWRI